MKDKIMNMDNEKQLKEVFGKFRRWLKESEQGVKDQTNYRGRQSRGSGWKNVNFFGPPSAVEFIKRQWDGFHKDNPHLWPSTKQSDESGESEES
jgi:hypothetical protein